MRLYILEKQITSCSTCQIINQSAAGNEKALFSLASDSRLLTSDNCFFTN